MSPPATALVHGTAVAMGARCVLLRGPSGAGKSDLALRLLALEGATLTPFGIDCDVRARLIADDQVHLDARDGRVIASAPATIRGLLEVRGIGIVPVHALDDQIEVRLVVDLVAAALVPRMPLSTSTTVLCGIDLPHLACAAFEASTPLKIALALQRV